MYYYDQSGASYSQGPGYIHTTLTKTGKLWWDPGLGGQGVIYSQIDGQGPWPPLPIAGVDNCSRVIKYVVLYGAKYSSYNLVDMRILDINAVADLTRHNPTAADPVENDGTVHGYKPCAAAMSFVGSMVSMSSLNTVCWWTGWWPVLHTKTSGTLESEASFRYQIAIDILGVATLEDMAVSTPLENGHDDVTIQAMVDQASDDFMVQLGVDIVLLIAEVVCVIAIEIMMSGMLKLPTPWTLAAFAVLVGIYVGLILAAVQHIYDYVLGGRLSVGVAILFLCAMLAILGLTAYRADFNLGRTWAKWWHCRGCYYSLGIRSLVTCVLSHFVVALKVLLFAVILGMILRCIDVSFGGRP